MTWFHLIAYMTLSVADALCQYKVDTLMTNNPSMMNSLNRRFVQSLITIYMQECPSFANELTNYNNTFEV